MNHEETETAFGFAASVVVPAHNEAAVIGRLLASLPSVVDGRRLHVVVACNGCTDETADIARRYGATVVELEASSKIAALNAADDVTNAFPRLYVDADVVLGSETIGDLIRTLSHSDVLCAAPPYRIELAGRPWSVRAYYSVWRRVMQQRNGYVGSGVYAISEKGRARFSRFPNIIADDLFVRNLYQRTERRIVFTDPTVVQAPWTLRALLRRRIRVAIGNSQLSTHAAYRSLPGNLEPSIPWWKVVLAHPALIPSSLIYAAVNLVAHVAAQRNRRNKGLVDWARDNTTRSASP